MEDLYEKNTTFPASVNCPNTISFFTPSGPRDETYKLWLDCNTNNSVVDIPGLSEKGEVYLSLAKTLSQSGCTFVYDSKKKMVTVKTVDGVKVSLFVDQKTCWKNGQKIILNYPVRLVKGSTFIPLEFFSKILEFQITKDTDIYVMTTGWSSIRVGTTDYWWQKKSQNLYCVENKQPAKKIGKLSTVNTSKDGYTYNAGLFDVAITPSGNYLVTIRYGYFSPNSASLQSLVNYDDRYYINQEQGKQYKTTTTLYDLMTIAEVDQNITLFQNGNVMLPGDNQVLRIDDTTGQLFETYNLQELCSTDRPCWYTHFNGTYLLARLWTDRIQGKTAYPVLVNVHTGEVTWLHKDLVPAEELECYENKEISDSGCVLEFLEEKDSTLYFNYYGINGELHKVHYLLSANR